MNADPTARPSDRPGHRPTERRCRALAALLALCAWQATPAPPAAPGRPEQSGAYYVDAYGLLDPAREPLAARALGVFDRVRAAASLPGWRSARLLVVAAPGSPWAIALPDGHIVLTRGAVELCYRDSDPALGETRLGFVLGHELAHLAKDDFWHDQVHRALMGDSAARATADLLQQASDANPRRLEHRRLKEAEADDWGFVYAAVAGFAVQRLLGEPGGGQDFFRFWAERTAAPSGGEGSHPQPADRTALLHNRLAGMVGSLELWRFGVRLLQAGRLDDARMFLEAFQERFPSPEVLANLGYIQLRQAMERMPAGMALRFWIPDRFAAATRAESLAGDAARGDGLSPEAAGLLRAAVEYLERATTLDGADVAAWTNLAVARFYQGEMHLARHAVEQALARQPGDPELAAFKAAIVAGSDPELDLWPAAVARLDALLAEHPQSPAVHWNLARLLAERGRTAAAQAHWTWLRERADTLPAPYAEALCGERPDTAAQCPKPAAPAAAPFPWPLPVQPGADLLADKTLAAKLEGDDWQSLPFDFGGAHRNGSIRWQPGRYAVLVLDGYADTVAALGPGLGSAAELIGRVGKPLAVRPLAGAELWSYGNWGARVRDGQVTEAWAMHDGDRAQAQAAPGP